MRNTRVACVCPFVVFRETSRTAGDDKNSPRGRPASLQEAAELEADVLRVVLVALDQGEPEVNRDRGGPEDREREADARADAGADDAEANVVLDVADVREEH